MRYQLPTDRQIRYAWDVKPAAKVVALILRDLAEERMEAKTDKEYNHMSQQDRAAFDGRVVTQAKVTISVRKLAQMSNASEEGVAGALDELQTKGFLESDRPKSGKGKTTDKGGHRNPYWYRLRPGADKYYKHHD